MNKKTIRDVDLTGKRVLVRVDYNVPVQDGKVTDDLRIVASLPTLKMILDAKPRAVILMSHLGRPKGERNEAYSLRPVADALAALQDGPVRFVDNTVGDSVKAAIDTLPEGGILLLENTRFYPGEKANDADFAKQLADLGDMYVNDAFGSAHRAHASTSGVAAHLPSVAGLLMEKEIEFLSNVMANPAKPFAAIMGGAKISDKIGVIQKLLDQADRLLIGGGMANTFFKAQGIDVADSLVEDEALDIARKLLAEHAERLILPVDVVIADEFSSDAAHQTISLSDGVPDGWRILDIGEVTVKRFSNVLSDAMTIVWNGPMGVFEMPAFAAGTLRIAELVAARTEAGATTIIGGGDSAAAIRQAGLGDAVTHVSTGGGASLELLEGKVLPGLAALDDK